MRFSALRRFEIYKSQMRFINRDSGPPVFAKEGAAPPPSLALPAYDVEKRVWYAAWPTVTTPKSSLKKIATK